MKPWSFTKLWAWSALPLLFALGGLLYMLTESDKGSGAVFLIPGVIAQAFVVAKFLDSKKTQG